VSWKRSYKDRKGFLGVGGADVVALALVASNVTQSGSTINGTWGSIVVVHTDPGYGPNPGHPGTGTIVATFC
jgi:hypothetical protein